MEKRFKVLKSVRTFFYILISAGFVSTIKGEGEPLVMRIVSGIIVLSIIGVFLIDYYLKKKS